MITGADTYLTYLSANLSERVTVHHCRTPEITLTSPSSATGIWAMEDRVSFTDGRELCGFGHYHETHRKNGGTWQIKTLEQTRIRTEITEPAR